MGLHPILTPFASIGMSYKRLREDVHRSRGRSSDEKWGGGYGIGGTVIGPSVPLPRRLGADRAERRERGNRTAR